VEGGFIELSGESLEGPLIIPSMALIRTLVSLGKKTLLATIATALAATSLPFAHAQRGPLPELGEPGAGEITPARERAVGEQIMLDIRRDPDYLNDPLLEDYVASIADRLVQAMTKSGQPRVQIDTFVVRDKAVNAFALPGGFVGFHSQLLATAKSEDEVASVMAHEIAHVSQRHIARMVAKNEQNALLGLGSVLLAALVAAKSPEAAQAAIAFGQAGAISRQLSFSRDMEREADRTGLAMLADAGYEPPAMLAFFKTLQAQSQLTDSQQFPYLRTHPLTTERMGEVQQRLESQDMRKPQAAPNNTVLSSTQTLSAPPPQMLSKTEQALRFALMSARARTVGLSNADGYETARKQCVAQQRDASPAQKAGGAYCEALTSLKLRDYASAKRASSAVQQQLVSQRRSIVNYGDLLEAEVLIAAGEGERAAKALEALRTHMPFDRARTFLYSEAALQARGEHLDLSRAELQSRTSVSRTDRQAWILLGQVFNAKGESGSALRATAESAIIDKDWLRAIALLQQAQPLVRADYVESSIVDSRLREVRRVMEEQKDNAKKRN
jgi:beta-barrel assembly-enhancing protease